MTNLSNIVVNPDTEIVIISKSELDNLKNKLEEVKQVNEVQQSLMRGYFDDMKKMKLELRELRGKNEFNT